MAQPGPDRLDRLATELDELRVMCARLAKDNAELRSLLAVPPDKVPVGPDVDRAAPRALEGVMSRRALGKALGAAAVTAVGAAALIEQTALPAAAANGSNVVAGAETTGEGRTSVRYDGTAGFPGVVLLGNDSTYGGQTVNYPAGLGGFAGAGATAGKGGVANGIYGFTDNGAGNGVVGYNSGAVTGSGAGVLGLAFAVQNVAVSGHNTKGTAISGTSDSTASDTTAVIGVISSTSPGGFSTAVRGQNNGTSGLGIGVWGSQAGSGWGVYATSASGIGLNATGGAGTGVSASGATAVSANGTTSGLIASAPTAVVATGGTTGLKASGPTAVSATGTTVGVSTTGPTAISATGASLGVDASGPTAVSASGSTLGLKATGSTAVSATGADIGLVASGPVGISATGTGPNGTAVSAATNSNSASVHALNNGNGPGVWAKAGPGSGIAGTAAVVGDSRTGTGVLGLSAAAVGVAGHSQKGRGGVFSGSAAQLKLTPGNLATHPTAGERGDLYADRNGHLWFCTGTGVHAKWARLA